MAKANTRRRGREAEDLELEQQRMTLDALARESLAACGNESAPAAERLAELFEERPALLRSVLRAVLAEIADQVVRRQVRNDRAAILAFATRATEAKCGLVQKAHVSVRDQSNAIVRAVLDMPLFNNVALRDAKRDQVTKYASYMGAQGRHMVRQEKFLLKISERLPEENSCVADYVSEDEALAFWQEAA